MGSSSATLVMDSSSVLATSSSCLFLKYAQLGQWRPATRGKKKKGLWADGPTRDCDDVDVVAAIPLINDEHYLYQKKNDEHYQFLQALNAIDLYEAERTFSSLDPSRLKYSHGSMAQHKKEGTGKLPSPCCQKQPNKPECLGSFSLSPSSQHKVTQRRLSKREKVHMHVHARTERVRLV